MALATAWPRVDALSLVSRLLPAGTRVSAPEGGYLYWIVLPAALDVCALYDAAMASGVSIAPGTVFAASGKADCTFRISIGRQWSARVEQAIAVIGGLCRQRIEGALTSER